MHLVAELSLGDVLDLSYSRAEELQNLLEKFLENEATIMLDEKADLEREIHRSKKCIKHHLDDV